MVVHELRQSQKIGEADMRFGLADSGHGGVAGTIVPVTQGLNGGVELRGDCRGYIGTDPLGEPAAAAGGIVFDQPAVIADLGGGPASRIDSAAART